ncbi:MAG: S1 RNA-binding domain-containing protein, partial [Proteobacteria bacterium]|nr:S1 RNA-binding domain-containing protein [Pseudomonadota bacterium]
MEKTNEAIESPEMEMNFADALDEYLNSDFGDLDEGTIVSGEIVKIDKDYVLVDVNFKSEGQIPASEFTDSDGTVNVQIGERVDVFVARKNEAEGTIYLSRDKAKRMQLFDKLEELMEKDGEVIGR